MKPKLYSCQGVERPLGVWAKTMGIPVTRLRDRLRRGWTLETLMAAQDRLDDRLTYNGETMSVEAWFRKLGLDPRVLRKSVVGGATVKKLLLLPRLRRSTHPHARQVVIDGSSKTIAEWAKAKGMDKHKLRRRLDSGWLPQFAVEVK